MLIRLGIVLGTFVATAISPPSAQSQASPPRHSCRFVNIPMRDGIKLNTSICEPQGQHQPLPFLLTRTPYGIAGDTVVPDSFRFLAADGYRRTGSGTRRRIARGLR